MQSDTTDVESGTHVDGEKVEPRDPPPLSGVDKVCTDIKKSNDDILAALVSGNKQDAHDRLIQLMPITESCVVSQNHAVLNPLRFRLSA